jgi:1,4-dihydroxy-2-naphthoyl-CoA hydrolase
MALRRGARPEPLDATPEPARCRLLVMSIWRIQPSIEQLQAYSRNTLAETIGIRVTEIGPDFVRATMPVNPKTHQPLRILHGGASVALAETVGSLAASLCVDPNLYVCLGQDINANHLRPVASGLVTATARPHHIGKRSQVWGIEIRDEQDKLVCVSRLTMAVVDKPKGVA